MEDFKIIKEIDLNMEVLTLKLLKDKRLAAGNEFGTLNIYDLTSYKPDITLNDLFDTWIRNINQLANDDLIVSSYNIVKIIKITKDTFSIIQTIQLTGGIFDMGYGSGGIFMICDKIIELSNNVLAICIRYHNLIQLWKKKDDGKYFNYDNLIEKEIGIYEIFEIRPNYLLSDNNHYNHLVIWDIEDKQKITILKKIRVNCIISDNKTSILNEKTIAYCGDFLYIIEKHTFCVIQKIRHEDTLLSICLFSKNILFVGDYKGILYQYEIEGSKIKLKEKNALKYGQICSIKKIDENRFAIGFSETKLIFLKK